MHSHLPPPPAAIHSEINLSTSSDEQIICYGKLVHDCTIPEVIESKDYLPERTVKIAVFVDKWLFGKEPVAEVYPNTYGEFTFTATKEKLKTFWNSDKAKLIFRLTKPQLPTADSDGIAWEDKEVEILHSTILLDRPKNDLGLFKLQYAIQYLDGKKIPMPSNDQRPSINYLGEFLKRMVEVRSKELLSYSLAYLLPRLVNQKIADVLWEFLQIDYPAVPLTWDSLMQGLLNEIMAVKPETDPATGELIWQANFDGLAFDENGDNSLANVILYAKPSSNGKKPEANRMLIGFRTHKEDLEVTEYQMIDRRSDPDEVEWAIYMAKQSFCTAGEAIEHLGKGHLLLGSIAWGFFKTIPKTHPLYDYLYPHLDQIAFINWLASKDSIFGKGSVLESGSLNPEGLAKLVTDAVVSHGDWSRFEPRNALYTEHKLALGDQLIHSGFNELFERLLEEMWPEITKEEHWVAVHDWSKLVHRYFPSCPPFITGAQSPEVGDKERLGRFCSWIFSIIYWHYAMHTSQDLLANIHSTTLAAQNQGRDSRGKLAKDGNTSEQNRVQIERTARALMAFKALTFLQSELQDVHPRMVLEFQKMIEESNLTEETKTFMRGMFKNIPI